MKYIFKNESGYFKFNRRIPNSTKFFTFSLQTQSGRDAKRRLNTFLLKSSRYFDYLKTLSKEEVVVRFDEIVDLLNEYKKQALEEYSQYEKSRHKHFSYNGTDGSNEEAIEYWTKELKDAICTRKTAKQIQELSKQILKRTTQPLKVFYQSIQDDEERDMFIGLLIKAEAKLLQEDYRRAKEYFDLEHNLENNRIKAAIKETIVQNIHHVTPEQFDDINVVEKAKYKVKNKHQVSDEYLNIPNIKNKSHGEREKVVSVVTVVNQCSDNEFLIEYTEADFEKIMWVLAYTPARLNQLKKIWEHYDGNYVDVAEAFEAGIVPEFFNNEGEPYKLEFQAIKTLSEKLQVLSNYLEYCVAKKYMERNIIQDGNIEDRKKFSSAYFKKMAKEAKERKPFFKEEIEAMFDEFVKQKTISKDIDFFYITIISLFSGMRVEEIAKLQVKNIYQYGSVWVFDIVPPTKTKSSIRKVPIHDILIQRFDLLKFLEKRTKDGEEYLFDLKRKELKDGLKHSHDFVQEFSEFRNQFISESRKENDLVSFHSLRHTFSTRLDQGGVELLTIGRLLGHNTKKMALQTPGYITPPIEVLHERLHKAYFDDLKGPLLKLSKHFKEKAKY